MFSPSSAAMYWFFILGAQTSQVLLYCCSSHPLCRVTGKTRKFGAMVELQAQEKRAEESGFFDVARYFAALLFSVILSYPRRAKAAQRA